MKMQIDFCTHYYEVEFLPFLGPSSAPYQEGFDKWYYEVVEEQGQNGEKMYCQRMRADLPYTTFDIEVVLDWFRYASPECQVRVVSQHDGCTDPNTSIPTLYF